MSICEASTKKLEVGDQESNPNGKRKNGRRKKVPTESPSDGPKEPASRKAIKPKPAEAAGVEEVAETVHVELSRRICGTEEDVPRIA